MSNVVFAVETISTTQLAIAFIPVGVVLLLLSWTSYNTAASLHAIARMLIQLLLIGYVLNFIFASDSSFVVGIVLTVMVSAASWISLRVVPGSRRKLLRAAIPAILLSGGLNLLIVTQGVLHVTPWYSPSRLIPLAGMIFANCMNAVSLAADRLQTELNAGKKLTEARTSAIHASLIPITNSLFAVGLVQIPGMMTGQILANVDPGIAARYQIMVMCMLFGSTGLASLIFVALAEKHFVQPLGQD